MHRRYADRTYLHERHKMNDDEIGAIERLLTAIERLQAAYDLMQDDQSEAKRYVRWAIKRLAEKVWSAAL